MPFYVYIMRMRDGRLYVGHSNWPPRRHEEHRRGKGCRTTGLFGAGEIIHAEEPVDRVTAACREAQVKRWSHAKKLALAPGRTDELKHLSRCRSRHCV
ncbi:MAG: GIY-YIG nuclease family protein [Verrucomicrobia bacterium]|nr:GIY-YIG nuclease family protein [Verrucomicrobiota bacterium]